MKRTTKRYVNVSATVCALLLSACAGTTQVSLEQRVLSDYARISEARTSANDKFAQGALSAEDWRASNNRFHAASIALDSSVTAMNRLATREAEVAINAGEKLLKE
jgi:hypothetical protein